ncbi:putative aldo-keto reductase 2 (fragment) [Microbacterium sp. C448]
MVDLLAGIATRKNATSAQIALAWLLAQNASIVPIPGTTKIHRLEENVGASSVALNDDELAQLTTASSLVDTSLARHPESMQKWIDR